MADSEIFDLACFVAVTRLLAGAQCPDDLRDFAGNARCGEILRLKGKPSRLSDWGRNFIIIRAMTMISSSIIFEGEDTRHHAATLDEP